MRRALAAITAVLLAFSLAACEPEAKGPSTERRPGAGQAPPAGNGGGGAQPAPAQADPSAHNTESGEVDLHLSWTNPKNGTTPLCEWSKNGKGQPCANMQEAVKEGQQYLGLWEHEETGQSGDVFTLNAEGQSGTVATCEIFFKGQGFPGTSSKTRCGARLVIP